MKFVTSLLLYLGLEVCLVAGDYVVEVNLQFYSNPTSQAAGTSGGCCDTSSDSSMCASECDNLFTFCLRPLNAPSGAKGCGPTTTDTSGLTSQVHFDQDVLVFDQDVSSDIPNPLQLSKRSTWQGIQLYIEVNDYDQPQQTPTMVDSFTVNIPTIGAQIPLQNRSGVYGYGMISLTARALCAEFYHGDQCQFLNMCELNSSLCTSGQICIPQMNDYTCVDCDPQTTNCDFQTDSSNPTTPITNLPGSTGGIIGGVVVALVVLGIAVIVFVVAVILAKRKKETTSVQVSHENGPTNYGSRESVNEAEFNNPLYGDNSYDVQGKTDVVPHNQEPNAYETPVTMYATVKH